MCLCGHSIHIVYTCQLVKDLLEKNLEAGHSNIEKDQDIDTEGSLV